MLHARYCVRFFRTLAFGKLVARKGHNVNSTENASPIISLEQNSPQTKILAGLIEYAFFPHGQGFAVVLNGPWGSGKTRFLKNNLHRFVKKQDDLSEQKPLYVSLYGVSNISQIEDRLFEQLHPILSHKATRLAGAILRGAAKAAVKIDILNGVSVSGSAGNVDLAAMLKNANGRVVFFDDFERAVMSPIEILGYINPLVEHEDCKVIILADETQISPDFFVEYVRRKEKTIGRTFIFKSDLSKVYENFLKEIDDTTAKEQLKKYSNDVGRIFAQSEFDNLRLLKQFMWDFEKVWKVLTQQQRDCDAVIKELIEVICVAALELKHGMLAEDFELISADGWMNRGARRDNDADEKPMIKLIKKYPTVKLDSTLLETNEIIGIVLRSEVDESKIRDQIQRHPYLAKPTDPASISWRTLWSSYELPAEEQGAAVEMFESDFASGKFSDIAVMYHIFGLALWLSKLGFPNWEAEILEQKLKTYVDEVYSRRKPTIDEISAKLRFNVDTGAYGLGFRETQNPLFKTLVDYEKEKRNEWRKTGYPDVSQYLLALATSDTEKFLREISYTVTGPATFAKVGAFVYLPPKDFVDVIIGSNHKDQSNILMGLSMRYDQMRGIEELENEIDWLRQVRDLIYGCSNLIPRIARDALLGLTRHYIDGHISQADYLRECRAAEEAQQMMHQEQISGAAS